jgi:hypothetical protein
MTRPSPPSQEALDRIEQFALSDDEMHPEWLNGFSAAIAQVRALSPKPIAGDEALISPFSFCSTHDGHVWVLLDDAMEAVRALSPPRIKQAKAVEEAYREGWRDGWAGANQSCQAPDDAADIDWNISRTRAALRNLK